ncbi:uncharacterized protein PAE49_001463 [Odontesthes bonariensis]|uniref:uncharacterized protein LOC142374490 n=1 Tax=Odontesthes bonariensis TaxID=219752 RepID=UPI003F58294D
MDELALERFFDDFIANDYPRKEEEGEKEEDVGEEERSQQDHEDDNESGTATMLPVCCPPPDPPAVPETPENHGFIPEIQNIVSTVRLGCTLDLNLIARNTWNTEYRPKTFKALVMRIRNPRTTANIYESGAILCSGATSPDDARRAARKFARIVQKLGFPVRFLNFQIHNIVASCSFFPLYLDALYLAYRKHCSYEHELFPGLFLKVVSGINATIFPHGKVNLSGAKTLDEVHKALDTIVPILTRFRKK